MQLTIILTTILQHFATSPDLCAEVHVDANGEPYADARGQTLSRYCEWTGPDAPVWDADVCCVVDDDGAACSLPDQSGACSIGARMYCKYGARTLAGVVCYQPLPSACDHGFCGEIAPPEAGPVEDSICCWPNGTCTEVADIFDAFDCVDWGGYLDWCTYGAQNTDGTIDCFDE